MIIAQIASLPDRVESLRLTIASLRKQVDKLFIALNGYKEVPEFILKDPFIEYVVLDNSLGDAAKFYDIDKRDGYFFACDDDLIYPKNYIDFMIDKIEQYRCVVSLHGRSFKIRPIQSYYKSATDKYRCLGTVNKDVYVDVAGTGTMAFITNDIKVRLSDFRMANMADIWLSKIAHEQKVPLLVTAHKEGFLKYIPQTRTIWDDEHLSDASQTEIINSFLK